MFACKTLLQLVVVGCVCAHFCGCNWVCTCTLCSDFTYVCAWKHERASGQETVEQQKSEGDCASDFLRTAQTNSLCFSPLHQMHFIFLEHISRNQFWEMEGPGFVCLGQDGTVWSLSTVKFFFFFFEAESVKTLVSADFLLVTESKHQILRFGSKIMYVLITVCPKNLAHYVISVSILCKLRKHLCVIRLLSIFFQVYLVFCYLWDGMF